MQNNSWGFMKYLFYQSVFITFVNNKTSENAFTMVNSEDFAKRLQIMLEYYDLSAAAFADAIDVGRSSISHILSGRNKPSLDFVLKIVQTYPEVELYWLLNGKGTFPASLENKTAKTTPPVITEEIQQQNLKVPDATLLGEKSGGRSIKKIVIFYRDGSFEAYEN